MIRLYGIPNCNKIRNTQKILAENNVTYEFINVRKNPIEREKLKQIANKTGLENLFNKKGTTYKRLGLNYDKMTDSQRLEQLVLEQSMIKRPLLEKNGQYLVGFDEEKIIKFISF